MSTQEINGDEDPVFGALSFLALQKQIADTPTDTMPLDKLDELNRDLLTKFRQAADAVPQSKSGIDILERTRQILGMNLAAGLFRKAKGVDVPKDLDDEIEQAIDEESKSNEPNERDTND